MLLRGGSPTAKTQYPIYESRQRYLSSLWMLTGVSADDRALIENRQPFQYGDSASNSYLSLLAWLNNVDKHRFVHVGGVLAQRVAIRVSFGPESPDVGDFPWFATQSGT